MHDRLLLPLGLLAAMAFLGSAGPAWSQSAADLSVLLADAPDPVTAGASLVYTVTVSDEGPDDAASTVLSDPLPAGTTFQSLSSPAGWSCTTPAVGAGGTVSCSNPSFAVGGAVFTLTVAVGAGVASGTVLTDTATVSAATPDPNPGSESAATTTTVAGSAFTISITKAGADLTYTLTTNNGGGDLEAATLGDLLPAGTTFVSLAAPAGWSCTTPAVGGTGSIACDVAPWPSGSATFTLVVHVGAGVPGGTSLENEAELDVTDSGRTSTRVAAASTRVLSVPIVQVPTLDGAGFLLLALALAAAAARSLRRRPA